MNPMDRAEKMEKSIMQNPVEQNSKNLSAIPKSIRLRREKNTARLEEKVQKMEEDMDEEQELKRKTEKRKIKKASSNFSSIKF
jgi:hypothetical protein